MTQYKWIQCSHCGWTGRTSELQEQLGTTRCPNCSESIEND